MQWEWLPESVPTVQTGRWQLLEATQPAQTPAVAEGWVGTLVCPADFLEWSEQGEQCTCFGLCLLPPLASPNFSMILHKMDTVAPLPG